MRSTAQQISIRFKRLTGVGQAVIALGGRIYGYNSYMEIVNVARLKNELSAYLRRVRTGEELLIRDRSVPIAKIVPLKQDAIEQDERSLVAAGLMTLPKRPLDERKFWAIGGRSRKSNKVINAMRRAMEAEREESDALLLGLKRRDSNLRSRAGK
jgi:prevent-host-death family protein